MEVRFYLGFKQVPEAEFIDKKQDAIAQGNTIAGSETVDGYKEYTLTNGTVIRGNKEGGFNRIEDGKIMEPWQVGTENEWIQGESTDYGKADFFFKE